MEYWSGEHCTVCALLDGTRTWKCARWREYSQSPLPPPRVENSMNLINSWRFRFQIFDFFINLMILGTSLDPVLGTLGGLGRPVWWFLGVLEIPWNFNEFQVQAERQSQGDGKMMLQGSSTQLSRRPPITRWLNCRPGNSRLINSWLINCWFVNVNWWTDDGILETLLG